MHSPQNKKRSNLLINGFIRHYKRTNDFNRFPSELVHLIFDLYYLIHGEWLNQNINIQIVSGVNGDKYEDVYLGAETAPWYPYAYDTLCVTDYPSFSSECETSIWRMYPKPECGGFILRPTNLLESESATKRKRFLGITGKQLCEAPNAVVLQFVQTKDCGNDEYYIQSIDNGQYLTLQCSLDFGHVSSVCFQDDRSKATLFRFKTYHPDQPLAQWRQRLTLYSHVLYRDEESTDFSVKGTVIATKHNGFGTEIKVKYSGYTDYDFNRNIRIVSGERWLPIESDLIFHPKSKKCPVLRAHELSADDFGSYEEKLEWKLAVGALHGEIGDDLDGITYPDGRGQYKRRVKSNRKRKCKSEKNQGTKERRQWSHKKWSGKDNDKRIERKSRKYGLVRKYAFYL